MTITNISSQLQPQGLADVVLCDQVDGPLNIVDPLAATEPRTDEGKEITVIFSADGLIFPSSGESRQKFLLCCFHIICRGV